MRIVASAAAASAAVAVGSRDLGIWAGRKAEKKSREKCASGGDRGGVYETAAAGSVGLNSTANSGAAEYSVRVRCG